MADIFGFNNVSSGGVFSAADGALTIDNLDSASHALLIQNWSVAYSQNLQPMYEIGSARVYWSKAHTVGSIQIGRIVSSTDILAMFSNGCNAKNMTITTSNGTCSTDGQIAGKIKLNLKGVVLTGVEWSGQAGSAYIAERLTGMFASLERN